MSDSEYVRHLADGLRISFDAFIETRHPQHGADLLACIADLKRLKPEWRTHIASALAEGELLVAQIGLDSLHLAAEQFDLSGVGERIRFLESIQPESLEDDDQQFLVRLAFDEFCEDRDHIELAFQEFDARKIVVPDEKREVLARFDERSKANEIIRWAMIAPRAYIGIYNRSALDSLWWWSQGLEISSSLRTQDCPDSVWYAGYARARTAAELTVHARTCDVCQQRIAEIWSTECAGWGILRSYVEDSSFPNQVAMQWHLNEFGCGACKSRLKLIGTTQKWIDSVGDWITAIWDIHTPVAVQASDFSRKPIRVLELFENPALVVEIEERDGSLLMQFTTSDISLSRKSIEFRLAGERFETRSKSSFESVSEKEWKSSTLVPSSEERLRDLSGRRFLSLRLRD